MKLLLIVLTAFVATAHAQDGFHIRRGLGQKEKPDKPEKEKYVKPKKLVKVDLGDMSTVEFLETDPGVLIYEAKLKDANKKDFFLEKLAEGKNKPNKEKDNAVKLYKRLTGKKAPQELEEAQARTDAAIGVPAGHVPTVDPEEEAADPGFPADTHGDGRELIMAGDMWESYICNRPYPYENCQCYSDWTTHGNGAVCLHQYEARDWDAILHVISPGRSASHKIRYEYCGYKYWFIWYCEWRTYESDTVNYDEYSILGRTGSEKLWKFYVYNAAYDVFHYSIWTEDPNVEYGVGYYQCPNIH